MDTEALARYGDAAAIFGFLALVVYFYRKPERTTHENILYAFSIAGFVVDLYLTVYRYML